MTQVEEYKLIKRELLDWVYTNVKHLKIRQFEDFDLEECIPYPVLKVIMIF